MTFTSEEDAHRFYNAYAGKIGFSMKCHTKHRADGTLSSKYFVCSNEGHKNINPKYQPKKERASTRTRSNARVQFYVSREGIWTRQKVILPHNHSFVSPNKAHMLRSQRRMTKADEHIISKMRQAGVRPTEIYDFFQRWSGGGENVQFLKMDCNKAPFRCPPKPKNFCAVPVTSNLTAHAWSTKCRRKKKLIAQSRWKLRDKCFEPN